MPTQVAPFAHLEKPVDEHQGYDHPDGDDDRFGSQVAKQVREIPQVLVVAEFVVQHPRYPEKDRCLEDYAECLFRFAGQYPKI